MTEIVIKNFILEISTVLKKSGHLFLWIDKFHLCEGIYNWIKNTDLLIVDMIVWNKQTFGMGYRSRRTSEYLLILQKVPIKSKGIWKIKNIPDVWNEKIIKKIHPHQKPYELQQKLILSVSNKNDLIIDPAAGSFSVLKICKVNQRNFLGTDIFSK
jgi:site-specific DNA-methyltransferase (adenine-specific)